MNNNDLYPYNNGYSTSLQVENELAMQGSVARVMRKVYGKMFLGLMATALTSFAVITSQSMLQFLFSHQAVFWVLIAAELGLVIGISAAIDKISSSTATMLFYLYSVVNGLVLTPIFFVYTMSSIGFTFLITSLTFGAMTVFGYLTRDDLSKFGAILIMALIGLIICSVINLFMHSTTMEWIISGAGVLIFVGLTAWDTQRIKQMALMSDQSQEGKVATLGALSLYLDFINLFLYLLRFFGKSE
ncbi:MAG: Bax inhibitor-1/YccA family protein [Muribaculaceae bacterium]|nr:Bax inhibitor-1/YccA family protein [Muribaculaceae bacterium]